MFTVIKAIKLYWFDPQHTILTGTVLTVEYGEAGIMIPPNYDLEWGRIFYDEAIEGKHGDIAAYAPPSAEDLRKYMQPLARSEFRLRLKKAAITTTVINAAIAAVADEELREDYEVIWEDGQSFGRLDPFVLVVFDYAGKTPEQADSIWSGE